MLDQSKIKFDKEFDLPNQERIRASILLSSGMVIDPKYGRTEEFCRDQTADIIWHNLYKELRGPVCELRQIMDVLRADVAPAGSENLSRAVELVSLLSALITRPRPAPIREPETDQNGPSLTSR